MTSVLTKTLLKRVSVSVSACQAAAIPLQSKTALSSFNTSIARRSIFDLSIVQPRRDPQQSHPRLATCSAAFHTSASKCILPAGPQIVDGTANDPAPVPAPSPSHGSYHWAFERLISAALIPLTIAPFATGSLNPVMDAMLCATILIHSHIGFESIIIDYIPIRRLPKTRALFWWGLRAGTIVVAVGLYEFETNDVGLTEAIKRIWTA